MVMGLLLFDLMAFYLCLYLAFQSRRVLDPFIPSPLLTTMTDLVAAWWIAVVFLLLIYYERLYSKRVPVFEELRRVWQAVSLATVVLFALVSLGKLTASISRLIFIFFWLYGLVIFPLTRLIARRLLYRLHIGVENLLIVGAGEAGRAVAKEITIEKNFGYRIIGFLDDKSALKKGIEVNGNGYRVLGKLKDYEKVISDNKIQTAVLAIPSASPVDQSKWASLLQQSLSRVLIVPDLKGIALLNADLYSLFDAQLFLIKIRNNLESFINRFVKRAFDLVLSLALLPVFLPILGLLSILIRIDSKGPALFRQKRMGRGARDFTCIKFRTMYANSDEILQEYLAKNRAAAKEWRTFKKLKGFDPRVTAVGRFLRKTSLDELPQILNILAGSMSFVGPRPYIENELKNYDTEKMTILLARPGLSGLWQVSGRNKLSFDSRVSLDVWYVLNWSLWLDLFILLKTFRVVLKKEGAF